MIFENKLMMDEIGSLKRVLKKIDDWKKKIFDILRYESLDRELLKALISDFPSYNEIKENYESFKNLNYKHLNNDSLNANFLGKDYLLSSFNSYHNYNSFLNNHIKKYVTAEKDNIYSHENLEAKKETFRNREFAIDNATFSPSAQKEDIKYYSEALKNPNTITASQEMNEEDKKFYYEDFNTKK